MRNRAGTAGCTVRRPMLRILLAIVCLGWGGVAAAMNDSGLSGDAAEGNEDIAIDADSISFEHGNNLVRAEGNVRIRRGNELLRADLAVLHTETRHAYASGNVVFRSETMEWAGDRFAYNFDTGRWSSGEFTSFVAPFYIVAAMARNLSDEEFEMQRAGVTTCELPEGHTHYRIQARRVTIRPDDRLRTRHAVLYLGRLPVFYLPFWHVSLDPDFGFRFQPGSSSRMGYYLLSAYRYRINPFLRGETHLDYRSRRGLAGGQDLRWDDPSDGAYAGRFFGYFINDNDPYLDRNPEALDIDEARYRFQLQHRQRYTPMDSINARLEYVSDEMMREDFFERDYRRAVQPDNFISYIHRRDLMTFGLMGRMRLNDFYEHIDRLPEAELDIHRRRLAQTPFYYESSHAAVALNRRRPRALDEDDFSVERMDTRHGLSWPVRSFGFLNIVPRVGGRGTYYSKTFETVTEQIVSTSVTTNEIVETDGSIRTEIVSATETETIELRRETGAKVRTAVEFGIESSFQASRVWYTEPMLWGQDLRHVVEPYMNYAFIPEPSVTPDQLHRFDDTDRLDKAHGVAFGVRNVLQTKRDQRSHDLLDVNAFSHYRLDAKDDENALGAIGLRAEARPLDNWGLNVTASYDPHEGILTEWNSRAFYQHANWWRADAEYRYRHEQSRLIAATLAVSPVRDWTFEAYGRYEAETSRLEEHSWHVQRELDCMVIRSGFTHVPSYIRADGTEREDEYRVTLELWLTAFPEMRAGLSGRR